LAKAIGGFLTAAARRLGVPLQVLRSQIPSQPHRLSRAPRRIADVLQISCANGDDNWLLWVKQEVGRPQKKQATVHCFPFGVASCSTNCWCQWMTMTISRQARVLAHF